MARGRLEGTVFVGEDFEHKGYGTLLTGTFSAHWESADGPDHVDGPEGVSADEAIAWGRRHADVVLIRLGDSDVHHSAGNRPSGDPLWPEGRTVEPRRFPGEEHLDLESEQPIQWEVRLPRRVMRWRANAELEQLRAALANDPAVSDLSASLERGKHPQAVFRFAIQARNHPEAMQAVLDVEHRTLDRFPYPVRRLRRRGLVIVQTGFDPVADIRPWMG